jgi:hypothetical protein
MSTVLRPEKQPYKPPHLKQGKVAKWVPKTWLPMYEEMVALSCAGRSNKTIAEQFDYTEQHISTILNCPKAKMVRREMLEFLRKSVESRMEERVRDLQDVALKRLTEVLTNDSLFSASPFAVVDRGLKVLQGTGVLRTEAVAGSGGIHAKNAIFIGSEAADTIREGLKAADEAKRLHAPKVKEEIILDATGT